MYKKSPLPKQDFRLLRPVPVASLRYRARNDEPLCSRHKPLIRIVASILVITFFWHEIVFAQGGPTVEPATSKSEAAKPYQQIKLREFSIPRNIGITKEVYIASRGTNPPTRQPANPQTIINIKDAHDNLSAQESIVSLLDNLVTNYEIRTVAVEGTAGPIDTSVISSFPNKEIKKKLADELMAEGMISAAEYYSITSDSKISLYGIDDAGMHSQNMDAFIRLLNTAEENKKKADALYEALAALEDHLYSEELKMLEHNSVLKNNGNVGFTKRWDLIRAIGEKFGVRPENCVNINNLLKAIELEKTCGFSETNVERETLLGELKQKLDKNRLEELILKSLSFKLGKISASMFYSHLVDLAKLNNIDPAKYPNVLAYVEYMTLYESIDINGLKDEVADYEAKIKEKLFRNGDERELSELLKKASVLADLIEIRLTSKSLKYYRDNKASFSAVEFVDFIRTMYGRYGMAMPSDLDIAGVFEAAPPAEEFYTLTVARNDAIVANTIKRMREKGETAAALVTGGFHTEGVAELLRKNKLSYLIILPKFDKTKSRPYITIITNKLQSYYDLAREGESHIALKTFFGSPQFNEECMGRLAGLLETVIKMNPQEKVNVIRKYTETFAAEQREMKADGKIDENRMNLNIARAEAFYNVYREEQKEEKEKLEGLLRGAYRGKEGMSLEELEGEIRERMNEGKEFEKVCDILGISDQVTRGAISARLAISPQVPVAADAAKVPTAAAKAEAARAARVAEAERLAAEEKASAEAQARERQNIVDTAMAAATAALTKYERGEAFDLAGAERALAVLKNRFYDRPPAADTEADKKSRTVKDGLDGLLKKLSADRLTANFKSITPAEAERHGLSPDTTKLLTSGRAIYLGEGDYSRVYTIDGFPWLVFKIEKFGKEGSHDTDVNNLKLVAAAAGAENCGFVTIDGLLLKRITRIAPFTYLRGIIIQQKAIILANDRSNETWAWMLLQRKIKAVRDGLGKHGVKPLDDKDENVGYLEWLPEKPQERGKRDVSPRYDDYLVLIDYGFIGFVYAEGRAEAEAKLRGEDEKAKAFIEQIDALKAAGDSLNLLEGMDKEAGLFADLDLRRAIQLAAGNKKAEIQARMASIKAAEEKTRAETSRAEAAKAAEAKRLAAEEKAAAEAAQLREKARAANRQARQAQREGRGSDVSQYILQLRGLANDADRIGLVGQAQQFRIRADEIEMAQELRTVVSKTIRVRDKLVELDGLLTKARDKAAAGRLINDIYSEIEGVLTRAFKGIDQNAAPQGKIADMNLLLSEANKYGLDNFAGQLERAIRRETKTLHLTETARRAEAKRAAAEEKARAETMRAVEAARAAPAEPVAPPVIAEPLAPPVIAAAKVTIPPISSTGVGDERVANRAILAGILEIAVRQGKIVEEECARRLEAFDRGEDLGLGDIELKIDGKDVVTVTILKMDELRGTVIKEDIRIIIIDADALFVSERYEKQYASAGLRRGVVYITRSEFNRLRRSDGLVQKVRHETDEINFLRRMARELFPETNEAEAYSRMSEFLKGPQEARLEENRPSWYIDHAHAYAMEREAEYAGHRVRKREREEPAATRGELAARIAEILAETFGIKLTEIDNPYEPAKIGETRRGDLNVYFFFNGNKKKRTKGIIKPLGLTTAECAGIFNIAARKAAEMRGEMKKRELKIRVEKTLEEAYKKFESVEKSIKEALEAGNLPSANKHFDSINTPFREIKISQDDLSYLPQDLRDEYTNMSWGIRSLRSLIVKAGSRARKAEAPEMKLWSPPSPVARYEIGEVFHPDGHGHRIRGGVSHGRGGEREIILAEWDEAVRSLYDEAVNAAISKGGLIGDEAVPAGVSKGRLIEAVFEVILRRINFGFADEHAKMYRNKLMAIGHVARVGEGVCRHMAILAVMIIERMIEKDKLKGSVFFIRGPSHAFGFSVPRSGKDDAMVIDVAQSEQDKKDEKGEKAVWIFGYFSDFAIAASIKDFTDQREVDRKMAAMKRKPVSREELSRWADWYNVYYETIKQEIWENPKVMEIINAKKEGLQKAQQMGVEGISQMTVLKQRAGVEQSEEVKAKEEIRQAAEQYYRAEFKRAGEKVDEEKMARTINAIMNGLEPGLSHILSQGQWAIDRAVHAGRSAAAAARLARRGGGIIDRLRRFFGGSGKRLGTDEDTGEKARQLNGFRGKFESRAKGQAKREVDGLDEDAVVLNIDFKELGEGNLTDVAAAYQFRTTEGTVVIVVNANTTFRKAVEASLKGTGITYDDVLKEVLFHEASEAYLIKQGYSPREAHIIASAKQAGKFARSELNGITPYHYSEIMRMTIEGLVALLAESRVEHEAIYRKLGIDGKAYEGKIQDLVMGRLSTQLGIDEKAFAGVDRRSALREAARALDEGILWMAEVYYAAAALKSADESELIPAFLGLAKVYARSNKTALDLGRLSQNLGMRFLADNVPVMAAGLMLGIVAAYGSLLWAIVIGTLGSFALGSNWREGLVASVQGMGGLAAGAAVPITIALLKPTGIMGEVRPGGIFTGWAERLRISSIAARFAALIGPSAAFTDAALAIISELSSKELTYDQWSESIGILDALSSRGIERASELRQKLRSSREAGRTQVAAKEALIPEAVDRVFATKGGAGKLPGVGITIGVVGIAQGELDGVRRDYPDVNFVALAKTGVEARTELEAVQDNSKVRILLDISTELNINPERGRRVDVGALEGEKAKPLDPSTGSVSSRASASSAWLEAWRAKSSQAKPRDDKSSGLRPERSRRTTLDKVVEAARVQSFGLAYPYIAGLDEDNISRLSKHELINIFEVIQKFLPQAAALGLDMLPLDEDSFIKSLSTTQVVKPAGYVDVGVTPENTEEWVKSYVGVLAAYKGSSGATAEAMVPKLASFQFDLMSYFSGKPPAEIRDVLARHEAVASAQYWESAERSERLAERLLAELEKNITDSDMISILAFDAKTLTDEAAAKNVKHLIDTIGDKKFVRVAVFRDTADEAIPEAIASKAIIVTRTQQGSDLTTLIRNGAAGRIGVDPKKIGKVAVAVQESANMFADIERDFTGKASEEMPSYILLSTNIGVGRIGEVNLANLLQTVIKKKPCFLAVGKFESPGAAAIVNRIEDLLESLGVFFKRLELTDVGKAISEIFYAIKQTAIAV